jgi:hypothetical protein
MILDLLLAVAWVLLVVWAVNRIGENVRKARYRHIREPRTHDENCGDQGGVDAEVCRRAAHKVIRPKAPDIGSGLPAGTNDPDNPRKAGE